MGLSNKERGNELLVKLSEISSDNIKNNILETDNVTVDEVTDLTDTSEAGKLRSSKLFSHKNSSQKKIKIDESNIRPYPSAGKAGPNVSRKPKANSFSVKQKELRSPSLTAFSSAKFYQDLGEIQKRSNQNQPSYKRDIQQIMKSDLKTIQVSLKNDHDRPKKSILRPSSKPEVSSVARKPPSSKPEVSSVTRKPVQSKKAGPLPTVPVSKPGSSEPSHPSKKPAKSSEISTKSEYTKSETKNGDKDKVKIRSEPKVYITSKVSQINGKGGLELSSPDLIKHVHNNTTRSSSPDKGRSGSPSFRSSYTLRIKPR